MKRSGRDVHKSYQMAFPNLREWPYSAAFRAAFISAPTEVNKEWTSEYLNPG